MKWLKEELELNRKEFLGISAMMCIGLIALVFQYRPIETEKQYDITIDDILLVEETIPKPQRQLTNPRKKLDGRVKYKSEFKQPSDKIFERFAFDPNTISKDSLLRLGFKKRVAETWVKFRSKGKKFHSEEDILSIYGVDSNLVSRLDGLLIFPKKEKWKKKDDKWKDYEKSDRRPEKNYKAKVLNTPTKKLDLNSCTEEDLKALGGIGRIFASRILKYRNLLGGYVHKDQLKEVYGLTDSTFQIIKNFVEISSPPELIQVNTASKNQLSEHFFIDYKSAKLIYAYRNEHGPFVDKDDFQSIKGIPEQKKNEILPYLSFAL